MVECCERLRLVGERVKAAAMLAGRDADQVKLIAVSKTQTKQRVQELFAAGHRDFGENTYQDAMEKIPFFPSHEITWHFVGHLQSNKAKYIAEHFAWVHSVDSLKLATKISDAAAKMGRCINILLQVNISEDPRKSGVAASEVYGLAEAVLGSGLPGIKLQGLMAIGPQGAAQSGVQQAFASMHLLQDRCAREFGSDYFTELSMGMSGDFEVAIEEGATMVRVGTAIFGARG